VLAACGAARPSAAATPSASDLPLPVGTATATPIPSRTASPASTPAGDGTRIYGTLASRATGLNHNWIVIYPPGSSTKASLPVVIVLHGMGDNIDALNHLNYHVHLGEAVRAGVQPFALAAIDGNVLFWQRIGTQDGGELVATDFLGLLAARGLDTTRLGLTGWSMGGWGTLRLAQHELFGRLRAAAPMSTPLYPGPAAAPERWISDADYEAGNPYTRPHLLTGLPLWFACGTSDQFYPGNRDFVGILSRTPGVPAPETHFTPGSHSFEFWESAAPDQFRFLGAHL